MKPGCEGMGKERKRERDRKGERVREREKRERKRFEKLNSVSETKSNQIDAHSESVRNL